MQSTLAYQHVKTRQCKKKKVRIASVLYRLLAVSTIYAKLSKANCLKALVRYSAYSFYVGICFSKRLK